MKAIKYYRPFEGDYTTRLAGRVHRFCQNHETDLFSFENNDFIPLKGFFSYMHHLEFFDYFSDYSDFSDFESEYDDKSVVILCFCPENDDLLQEIFSILSENEKLYADIKRYPTHYGHPELIEIPADPA